MNNDVVWLITLLVIVVIAVMMARFTKRVWSEGLEPVLQALELAGSTDAQKDPARKRVKGTLGGRSFQLRFPAVGRHEPDRTVITASLPSDASTLEMHLRPQTENACGRFRTSYASDDDGQGSKRLRNGFRFFHRYAPKSR
jgi:hypothetical protein